MSTPADLVFVNGAVYVMDEACSVSHALAVRDGVVVALGAEAEELAGRAGRVVDMAGGCLLPGINDSHCHAISYGMSTPPLTLDLNFPNVRSIADIVEAVREAVAGAQPGEWIVGAGWDPGFLAECTNGSGREPTRLDLDPVSPDNPVYLQDFSYHTAWVNSVALSLGGIDSSTKAPPGSMIIVDEEGLPTGILNEGAMHTLMETLPPLDREGRTAAAISALRQLNALGITSLTEPGLGPGDANGGMAEEGLSVYEELLANGQLTARVTALAFPVPMSKGFEEFKRNLDGQRTEYADDPRMLNVVGVKILADGIPPNRTAWMHDCYVGGGRGALTIEGDTDEEREAQLRAMIEYGHRLGFQMGVHVTGDRGIDAVVDAFAAAVEAHPRDDTRHYVIHGDFMTRHSLDVCRKYNFGVNMNPTIKWTIADLEKDFVGPERAAYEWPYRDAIDAGLVVASSSDAPVTHPDWRQGVTTMMTRKSKASGEVSGPDQVIGLFEALRTYTVAGAWQDFAESWKGTLEPGMVADLCLLRSDLREVTPDAIPAVEVAMTVLGGAVVYEG